MTSPIDKEMEQKFPLEEEFFDPLGQTRRFRISLRKMAAGDFSIEATELPREGYRFEVYSPIYSAAALGSALGDLRRKISRGLATRYLRTDKRGQKTLTHDELRGRISYNGLIVDGTLLEFREFEEILTTHEGFQISIKISDRSE